MTGRTTGLCVAGIFGLAISLGAQTTTTAQTTSMDHNRDHIAVTGCLQRDANGGFILANARIDPSEHGGSSSTTTTTGTTGTTATTTTSGTTTAEGSEAHRMSENEGTWKLEGSSSDLDRHVGQRVTVTGREDSSSSSTATTTTAGTTTGTTGTTGESEHHASSTERHLKVDSVKSASGSCS